MRREERRKKREREATLGGSSTLNSCYAEMAQYIIPQAYVTISTE